MDTARQVMGVLLVVGIPPAIAYWFVVHPFARWWRRWNARFTYSLLAACMIALAAALFALRGVLLGRDLGTNWTLIGIGVVLYVAGVAVTARCRRQLGLKIFVGVPEVSDAAFPGRLLQDGIYGVIRHPRYVSVILGTAGWALVVNHLGAYLVVAACLASLWPLVVLEERELASRFGAAYVAYRARVPALVPRIRRQ